MIELVFIAIASIAGFMLGVFVNRQNKRDAAEWAEERALSENWDGRVFTGDELGWQPRRPPGAGSEPDLGEAWRHGP